MLIRGSFYGNLPKPKKTENKVHWNTENHSLKEKGKRSENSTYQSGLYKIYASMAQMSYNVESLEDILKAACT